MPIIKLFSWNFGKSTIDKLECIKYHMLENADPANIYVIGLQEVSASDLDGINMFFMRNKNPNQQIVYGKKPSTKNFDLVTYVFYPPGLIENIKFSSKSIKSNKGFLYSFVDTKGYLWIDFTINNVKYTIVNIHLPFQNEAFSLLNFQQLAKTFNDNNNVIIFGDYNTRSKVDDSCLGDTPCNVSFEKNAKGNVSSLENALNNCSDVNKRSNTITSDVSYDGEMLEDVNCAKIRNKMIQYDYLNESQVLSQYKEDDITFLPTYKIDDYGDYRLVKKNKRRLAGYADRILVKGAELSIVPGSYGKINCLGNDHFPIVLEVNIMGVMGGKKRVTRKYRNKKNKSKRRILKKN